MLKQYGLFWIPSVRLQKLQGNAGQTDIAKTIGFESNENIMRLCS